MTDLTSLQADARDVPAYPQARGCPFQPPTGYERYTAAGPVSLVELYDGRRVWAVSGHAEARQVLLDAATFSSDRMHPHYPATAPRFESARKVRNFIGMDPPEHTVQRRMLLSHFTVKKVQALRPRVQRLVDDLIDTIEAKGPVADLVPDFALPVPSIVICELLGVPYTDHAFFEQQSRRVVTGTTSLEDSADAFAQLSGYLDGLIRRKEREPGDGLLDTLVAEQLSTGALTRRDLVDIALLLLVAGHETTASAIALGVLTLLEHPDQLAALRSDATVLPSAVEELLRYMAIADGVARFATTDTELGGHRVRAGDGVVVVISTANRDDVAFPGAGTFDVTRGARHHVSFGHGVHQCIGQNLARAEMEIALSTLFRRLPGLRLAVPAGRLKVKEPGGVQGVWELPVTW
ncbi:MULTISPECIES: cytochrome P450 [unclassified Streptomyces]|uniref:cytochrome P450 n=1 Tax=unclassified Streptomyces TaxID=2593676 RepID=UPI0004C92386|nr:MULTISPECIES: cytochrome P450 [unclassified Streptomyces]KOV74718.1 cytochrome P450 [Streptomyces sp. NRRL WC-3723]